MISQMASRANKSGFTFKSNFPDPVCISGLFDFFDVQYTFCTIFGCVFLAYVINVSEWARTLQDLSRVLSVFLETCIFVPEI